VLLAGRVPQAPVFRLKKMTAPPQGGANFSYQLFSRMQKEHAPFFSLVDWVLVKEKLRAPKDTGTSFFLHVIA